VTSMRAGLAVPITPRGVEVWPRRLSHVQPFRSSSRQTGRLRSARAPTWTRAARRVCPTWLTRRCITTISPARPARTCRCIASIRPQPTPAHRLRAAVRAAASVSKYGLRQFGGISAGYTMATPNSSRLKARSRPGSGPCDTAATATRPHRSGAQDGSRSATAAPGQGDSTRLDVPSLPAGGRTRMPESRPRPPSLRSMLPCAVLLSNNRKDSSRVGQPQAKAKAGQMISKPATRAWTACPRELAITHQRPVARL
jgi:hypothetical protein